MNPNLNELAQRIHEQNKAAGWWDKPRPRVQTAWLIITELAEATEAERAGRYADLEAFENNRDYKFSKKLFSTDPDNANVTMAFKASFERHIKDTFEDEIADAVIRLLDFSASEGKSEDIRVDTYWPVKFSNEQCFVDVSQNIAYLVSTSEVRNELTMGYFNQVLSQLIVLADRSMIDLWKHIELKLKYNQTRGKMHGGKKF